MRTVNKFNKIYHVLSYLFGAKWFAKKVGVSFGKNCRIYTREFGNEPYLISIGNNVTVTANVKFITHDGSVQLISKPEGRYYYYDKITIGNNVFIGANSVILPGAKIGNNCIIGAMSLIRGNLEDDSIYAGNPVRKLQSFFEFGHNKKDKLMTKEQAEKYLLERKS